MNNEACKTEVSLMVDSFICEYLNDEESLKFHHAVLVLVAAAIETQSIFLPSNLYCKYQKTVMLSDGFYRRETETNYRILCRLIISTYRQTTFPEEREGLKKLIEGIYEVIQVSKRTS